MQNLTDPQSPVDNCAMYTQHYVVVYSNDPSIPGAVFNCQPLKDKGTFHESDFNTVQTIHTIYVPSGHTVYVSMYDESKVGDEWDAPYKFMVLSEGKTTLPCDWIGEVKTIKVAKPVSFYAKGNSACDGSSGYKTIALQPGKYNVDHIDGINGGIGSIAALPVGMGVTLIQTPIYQNGKIVSGTGESYGVPRENKCIEFDKFDHNNKKLAAYNFKYICVYIEDK